jgi:hypothetical protein
MNKYSDLIRRLETSKSTKIMPHNDVYIKSRIELNVSNQNLPSSTSKSLENYAREHETVLGRGISPVSIAQNQATGDFIQKVKASQERFFKLPDISLKTHSYREFDELINKLDEISTPKMHLTEIIIDELSTYEFTISNDCYQTFKIYTKGKKSPMCVKIQKKYGEMTVYASLTNSRPGINDSSPSYKINYFEVHDLTHELKNDFGYISVKSISDCKFKIHVSFGKIKSLNDMKKLTLALSIDRLPISPQDNLLKNKNSPKNFVKANLDIKLFDSLTKAEDLKVKGCLWKNKREKVVLRKKILAKEKKKKNLENIAKKVKRLEKEVAEREKSENYHEFQRFNKLWIKYIYIVTSLNSIRDLITKKRASVLNNLELKSKVRRLQKFYKQTTKILKLNPQEKILLSCLKLYRKVAFPVQLHFSSLQLLKVITISSQTNILFSQISSFFKAVDFIKRQWKLYKIKKNFRFKKLKSQWNRCLEKILFAKPSSFLKNKYGKRLTSVPITIRDRVLKDHYLECWKAFGEQVRKCLSLNASGSSSYLVFSYIPDNLYMENLIKKVINIKGQTSS